MRLMSDLMRYAGAPMLGAICLLALHGCMQSSPDPITLECTNPLAVDRHDAVIEVDAAMLRERGMTRELRGLTARLGEQRIPLQQVDDNGDGVPEQVLLLLDLAAGETRRFTLVQDAGAPAHTPEPRAHAEVSVRSGATLQDGVYAGGEFVRADHGVVPDGHTAHDGYFRYEGPGWESDRVGYRVYLDSRNRCDIFGKKTRDLVLHTVGVHDLVSDGKESYTKMQEWGMDIFKVGQSLGIGSPGVCRDGRVEPLLLADSTAWSVDADGPLRASVVLQYRNRSAAEKPGLSAVRYSIDAGSRLTRVDVTPGAAGADLCTGLARHDGCRIVRLDPAGPEKWGVLGLYGQQTLAGDSLGIAVFFRGADLVRAFDDSASHVLVLRPSGGELTYYFAATWEQEPGGITNGEEFSSFLQMAADRLSVPVTVTMH